MKKIPCLFMRAGTSKGPFLDLRDLPEDPEKRNTILLRIMGSPDQDQIDGIGGAAFVTSKVVMANPSDREGIDVNYLFAQVIINKAIVDTNPNCGNMMSGVGHLAIERGWVKPIHPETSMMIYNYNTQTVTETVISTPNGIINYDNGDTKIDGVPGTGAPVLMNFFRVAGGTTGKLFPTGNRKDIVDGIEISIVDAGHLMVLAKAESFGLNGMETSGYFINHPEVLDRIEAIRLEVGLLVGLGDVSNNVLPKVGLLSNPRIDGHIKSQYFTPKTLHPTHAVSGAVCIATACKASGTVAADIAIVNNEHIEKIIVEHNCGAIPVQIEVEGKGDDFDVVKAGTLRTVRKLIDGFVFYSI